MRILREGNRNDIPRTSKNRSYNRARSGPSLKDDQWTPEVEMNRSSLQKLLYSECSRASLSQSE